MATRQVPLFNASFAPDASGEFFQTPAEVAMALGTAALGTTMVWTWMAPTGADIGFYTVVPIPIGYVGTPEILIRGVVAEAANTIAFGASQYSIAVSESIDVAYETADLVNNATWTGLVAEDRFDITITLTPAVAYAEGDLVPFFIFRDDSVDTQTGDYYAIEPVFQYADA